MRRLTFAVLGLEGDSALRNPRRRRKNAGSIPVASILISAFCIGIPVASILMFFVGKPLGGLLLCLLPVMMRCVSCPFALPECPMVVWIVRLYVETLISGCWCLRRGQIQGCRASRVSVQSPAAGAHVCVSFSPLVSPTVLLALVLVLSALSCLREHPPYASEPHTKQRKESRRLVTRPGPRLWCSRSVILYYAGTTAGGKTTHRPRVSCAVASEESAITLQSTKVKTRGPRRRPS